VYDTDAQSQQSFGRRKMDAASDARRARDATGHLPPPHTCHRFIELGLLNCWFTRPETRAVLTGGHTGHVPRAPGFFLEGFQVAVVK